MNVDKCVDYCYKLLDCNCDYEMLIYFSAKTNNINIIELLSNIDEKFVEHISNSLVLSIKIGLYEASKNLIENFYQHIDIKNIYIVLDEICKYKRYSLNYLKLIMEYFNIDITYNNYGCIKNIIKNDKVDDLKFLINNFPDFDIHYNNNEFFYLSTRIWQNKIFNFLLEKYGSTLFIGIDLGNFNRNIEKIKQYFNFGIMDHFNIDELFDEFVNNNFSGEVYEYFISMFPEMKYCLDIDKSFNSICKKNLHSLSLEYLLQNFPNHDYEYIPVINKYLLTKYYLDRYLILMSEYITDFDITYNNHYIIQYCHFETFKEIVDHFYSDNIEVLIEILETNMDGLDLKDKLNYLKNKIKN